MTTLSILDLATIPEGATAADALARSLDLAQHAERWGYRRFWLAEHHNMIGIASAATSVVICHVAGGTRTIRVGAGGIMLPNHSPRLVSTATREHLGFSGDAAGRRRWLAAVHAYAACGGEVGWQGRDPFVSAEDFARWQLTRSRAREQASGGAVSTADLRAAETARMLGVELTPTSGRRRAS